MNERYENASYYIAHKKTHSHLLCFVDCFVAFRAFVDRNWWGSCVFDKNKQTKNRRESGRGIKMII